MLAIPNKLDYSEPHATIPKNTTTLNTISTPVNGSTFTAGQQIFIDLPARGFLVGDTLSFRYKASAVSTGVGGTNQFFAQIIGCPVYTPFSRLETYCGSQQLEVINQYNQVETMLSNLTLGVSDKFGLQNSYGYTPAGNTTIQQLDGRNTTNNVVVVATVGTDTYYVTAPIHNVLSMSEKYIPLFQTGSIRLVFTVDSLTNMAAPAGAAIAALANFTISNFEVCYELVDMPDVQSMLQSKGTPIYLKSINTINTAQTQPLGTNGINDYVFNVRAQSVKSAFLHPSGTAAGSLNRWADSWDVTQRTGEYSIMVGNVVYPSRPLSALNNPAGIQYELKKAVTSLIDSNSVYGRNNAFSIDSVEWGYTDDSTTASTLVSPSKFIVGFHLENLHLQQALLSGISTQNTPISVRISTNVATVQPHNLNLILFVDSIIEIDPNGVTSIKI